MRNAIFDFIIISVVMVAFIGLVIVGIFLTEIQMKDTFSVFISCIYLATCIFFLFDIIYSLEEEIDFVWKRRNFCGMVECVLGIPVCIGVIASGWFKSISSMINWVILGLILVFMVSWIIYQGLRCNDAISRNELQNTVKKGMSVVTFIGILQTAMPDNYLKILFVIMGCVLLILQEVFQNKKIN